MTATLRQQLIAERVQQVAQALDLSEDDAFERFAHSTYTGQSMYSFDINDLVDGSSDKGVDTISIEEDDDEATIYILSMKNTAGFSSNAEILLCSGLGWIFKKARSDFSQIKLSLIHI